MATARTFNDSLGEDELADRYRDLLFVRQIELEEAGYNGDSWKRAAHEIWHSQPAQLRKPRTARKLAEAIGVNERQLRRWRQAAPERYTGGVEASKLLITEWLPDVVYAAYKNAVEGGASGAQDRRLLAEIGGLRPSTGVDVTTGGAPIKTYSVLAHPDMWDDKPEPTTTVDPAPLADSAVER